LGLSADALESLSRILGVNGPQDRGELKAALEGCAGSFIGMQAEHDHGPSPAEIRKELDDLAQRCLDLESSIQELSGAARAVLSRERLGRKDYTEDTMRAAADLAKRARYNAWGAVLLLKGKEARGARESEARKTQVFLFFQIFRRFYNPARARVSGQTETTRGRPKKDTLNCAVNFLYGAFGAFYSPRDQPSEDWLREYKPLRAMIADFERVPSNE
jgi:hypothetical protein